MSNLVDAVLQDVADSLRKCLRAFDLVYRLGGEEFLVLLPGVDTPEAASVAEGLRVAVAAEPHGTLPATMSFGVSARQPGSCDYEHVFEAADQALYAPKLADAAAPAPPGLLTSTYGHSRNPPPPQPEVILVTA